MEPFTSEWYELCLTGTRSQARSCVVQLRGYIDGISSGNVSFSSVSYSDLNQVLAACALLLGVAFVIRQVVRLVRR